MDKKNIQEKDMENVSGGAALHSDRFYCKCQGCGTEFDLTDAQSKSEKDGCMGSKVYHKCPKCGKWVSPSGKVQG